ncbi:hypothetical protein [Streptomyces platensis]
MTSAKAGLDRRNLLGIGVGGLIAAPAGCAAESGPVRRLRFATRPQGDWGSSPAGRGKTTWFELTTP